MSIPDELAPREKRPKKLAEAKAKIEARARERVLRASRRNMWKSSPRAAKEKATGKKVGGKPPRPPTE